MWLLYLLISLILLGIFVLGLIQYDAPLLDELENENNLYFPYHILVSFYSVLLGDYGIQLRQRSFARLLNSENHTYTPALKKLKEELFAEIMKREDTLTVVEPGAGPGVNFHYYPKNCDVVIVEPVAEFKSLINEEIKKFDGVRLKQFLQTKAENMKEIESNSVDVVITSDLLCSVNDPHQVLSEIHRILKPSGIYFFSEHTLDKPGSIRRILQDVLMWTNWWPLWMMGCTFIDISALFTSSQFTKLNAKPVKLSLEKFAASIDMIAPHYLGTVEK